MTLSNQTSRYKSKCIRMKFYGSKNKKKFNECEGGIEKFAPWITVWHHRVCRVMTYVDPVGRCFLFHPQTIN